MRLLLDEHFSPVIAEQLRARQHEVVAVSASPDLRQQPDPEIFAWAVSERRALVTEDVADYLLLHEQYVSRGERHYGLVLTTSKRFPRHEAGFGLLVRELDRLLQTLDHELGLESDIHWL